MTGHDHLRDLEWLREHADTPIAELEEATGRSRMAIWRAYRAAGVRRGGSRTRAASEYPPLNDREFLMLYADTPLQEVAGKVGCSPNTVLEAYRRHQIQRHRAPSARRMAIAADLARGETLTAIANRLGITRQAVLHHKRALEGLPRR